MTLMTQTNTTDYLYKQKTGPVAIPMTNDYLFRAIMQKNEKVLRGLISALLHLEENQILCIEIKNPIELGTYVEDKDFFLDLKVLLNGKVIVNLELQVINEHNWPERSMVYLCRAFDNLNSGEDYYDVRPAIQIGLLDFSLDKEHPEFYSSHRIMNVKSHRVYSDKLTLNVLELRESALATEEDKAWKIDCWARFFKAKTWEEITMLAQELPVLNEAAETVYHISLDDQIRQQCEAREDFFRRQRTTERLIEHQKKELADQKKVLAQKDKELAYQRKELAQRDKELVQQRGMIAEKDDRLKRLEELLILRGFSPDELI